MSDLHALICFAGSQRSTFMKLSFFTLLASLAATSCSARAQSTFYVAPSGSDANAGTQGAPFQTLSRAQNAARIAKTRGAVTVVLRGGTYFLPETLSFGSQDSGAEGAPVVYRAAVKAKAGPGALRASPPHRALIP